jgi:hypothetical protein
MKKQPQLTPIADDQRYAAASTILRTLQDDERAIEHELDSLRIEGYLASRPNDSRAPMLRERLKKNRAASPPKKVEPPKSDLPAAVVVALELLQEGRRPTHASRAAQIDQLEADRVIVHQAVIEQSAVVEALRDELSHQLAKRLQADHRALVLAQYRALQALAVATDAERLFRAAVTNAGYQWREDLLPAPTLRTALIVGSESEHDSEVSRTRRLLEELRIIGGST